MKLHFSSTFSRQIVCERAGSVIEALVGRNMVVKGIGKRLADTREFEEIMAGVRLKYLQEGVETNRFSLFGTNGGDFSNGAADWKLRR